jgi:NADPH:quinone reductase-like Zn-dependent oxidoreductase
VDAPGKLEMLRLIGADHVIDYTREDYTKTGQQYDVILDLAAHRTIFESRRALTSDGIYLMAGGSWTALWQSLLLGPLMSARGKGSVRLLAAVPSGENLVFMTELFEAGKFVPVIDGCYPLSETAAALRRVGEKESRGKVVITP